MTTSNRGRPRTYSDDERRTFAELVRQHGARGARDVVGQTVLLNTLLKIADEFGIELRKGRRAKTNS